MDEIEIEMLFGYRQLEQRYVKTGPGTYECQGRSKRYGRGGDLQETTEWSALSSISNVPDEMAYLLR